MATINAQNLSFGLQPVFVAASAGGDSCAVGPTTILMIENSNAATRTVTIAVPGTDWNGVAAPDTQFTVAVTPGRYLKRLDPRYADPVTGRATVTYSTEVGLTIAVIALT